MGLLGYIAGGALQGLGTGMVKDAQAQRDAALEATRQAAEAQRQAAAQAQQTQRDATLHGYDQDNATAATAAKLDQLQAAGQIDQQKAATQHVYKLGEIKTEQVGKQQLAVLQSQLDTSKDAASIKLKNQLDSGDISTVVRGKDGQYYGVTDKGLVATGVQAAPTSGEMESGGGGRLSEAEQATAYSQSLSDWRKAGGDPGSKPKESDFIGMTHADYYSKYHAGSPVDTGGSMGSGSLTGSVASPASTAASTTQLSVAKAKLGAIYPNATPETYPGLFRNGKKISQADALQMLQQAGS